MKEEPKARHGRRRRWMGVIIAGLAAPTLALAALPLPAAARVAPLDGGGVAPSPSVLQFKPTVLGRFFKPQLCEQQANLLRRQHGLNVQCRQVTDENGITVWELIQLPGGAPPPPPPERPQQPQQACRPQPFPIPILPGSGVSGQRCG